MLVDREKAAGRRLIRFGYEVEPAAAETINLRLKDSSSCPPVFNGRPIASSRLGRRSGSYYTCVY